MEKENVRSGETVLAIVKGGTVKPADTRCLAKSGNGRCKEEITFNPETGDWVIWCEKHQKQEKVAREEGGERVERVDPDADDTDDE